MPPDQLKPVKTFRDPVHGDIKLTELEVAIIDTPEFQRLGRVRQLGTTNLVYRGALHTRFDHALGTTHQADRMVACINVNPDSKKIPPDRHRLIRLGALLHDITHVPFGHTLEDEAGLYPRHDTPEHFRELIGADSRIGKIVTARLGNTELERLVAILTAKDDQIDALGEDAVAADIVGNTICADLLDYLARDTYFTGLPETYGSRFLDYLYVPAGGDYKDRVVVRLHKLTRRVTRSDIPSEILGLLRLRYRLAEVVYYHHNKMCTSAMISAAVQNSRFGADRPALYNHSDDELIYEIANGDDRIGAMIAGGLRNRALYRAAYMVPYVQETLGDSKYVRIARLVDRFGKQLDAAARRQEMERSLEQRLSLAPGSVIIYCPDQRMQMKIAEARVAWHEEAISTLQEAPDRSYVQEVETIQQRHRGLWKFVVYVHPDAWDSHPGLASECEAEFALRNELYLPTALDRERVERSVKRWALNHLERKVTVEEAERLAASVKVNGGSVGDETVEAALSSLRQSAARSSSTVVPKAFLEDPDLEWLTHPDLGQTPPDAGDAAEVEPLRRNLRLHLRDIRAADGLADLSADVVDEVIRSQAEQIYELASAHKPAGPVKRRARKGVAGATVESTAAIESALRQLAEGASRLDLG